MSSNVRVSSFDHNDIVRKNEENNRLVLNERSARLKERHDELDKHVKDFKTERERSIELKGE